MKIWLSASVLALLPVIAIAADAPPEWAYPAFPPGFQAPPPTDEAKHVAGSPKTYTEKDIGNAFGPPDWFPNEHPAQPDIVAHGKRPEVNACALCHLSSGHGHPSRPIWPDSQPDTLKSSCMSSRTETVQVS